MNPYVIAAIVALLVALGALLLIGLGRAAAKPMPTPPPHPTTPKDGTAE